MTYSTRGSTQKSVRASTILNKVYSNLEEITRRAESDRLEKKAAPSFSHANGVHNSPATSPKAFLAWI